jgi:hypothetical protein
MSLVGHEHLSRLCLTPNRSTHRKEIRLGPRFELEASFTAGMLTVVTFLWKPLEGYRSSFEGRHVDVLRRMVRRHYQGPHTFVCITDDSSGITEPDVAVMALWDDHAQVPNPSGPLTRPSCYRRLKIFAADAGTWLGERIVCLDLDCVITGDVSPLWDRPEDFVIWESTSYPNTPYNGSMILLRAGSRPQVWERFDPLESPKASHELGYHGSDQAWIAACLGPAEHRWTKRDGIYSYRTEPQLQQPGSLLPAEARVVFFNGRHDPWDGDVYPRLGWVRQHWR